MEQVFGYLAVFLGKLSALPAYAPFMLILLIVAFILYRAHVGSNDFSVFDFIRDNDTGKGSLEKVGMLFAILTVTWWFMDLTARGVAKYEDAIAYAGLMGLARFAKSWVDARYNASDKTEK